MAKTFKALKKIAGSSSNSNFKESKDKKKAFKDLKVSDYDFSGLKSELENNIRFDTLESDLTKVNKSLLDTYNGWQTQETMTNTRTSIESMQNRMRAYKEYVHLFGDKNASKDISGVVESYGKALDDWDSLSADYGRYKNAKAYTNEKTKLSELYSMPSKEIEPYLKDKKNAVAYTTSDGYNITWKDLYDDAYLREYTEKEKKNPDFAKTSAYKKKDVKYEKTWNGYSVVTDKDAHLYNYINGDEDAQGHEEILNVNMYGTSDSKKNSFLTEEEKAMFNSLWETQGPEKAKEYLELLNSDLRERRVEHQKNITSQMAKENPVGASVVSVIENIGNNALALPFMAMDYAEDGSIDPNSSLYTGRRQVQTARSTVENDVIDGDVGKFFYRHGMNVADNLASRAVALGMGTGAASQFLMSSGAVVDTVIDAKERGLSEGQALSLGAISGAAEWFFESKGFESWADRNALTRNAWQYFTNNLKTELMGEIFTEGTNDIADYFISQDSNKLNTEYQSYLASGLSEKEAFLKVVGGVASRYADVAAGTIFSTGVMAGPGATIGGIQQHSQNKHIGQNIKDNAKVQDVFDFASASPEASLAYEAYTRYANKGINAENISDAQLGRLWQSARTDAEEVAHSKKSTGSQTLLAKDDYAKLGDMAKVNIEARYNDAITKDLNKNAKKTKKSFGKDADIEAIKKESVDNVTERLTELGETENVEKIADIVARNLVGEEISKDEVKVLRDSKYGARVLNENNEGVAEFVKGMDSVETRVFNQTYDGDTDIEAFATSFNLVSEYARHPESFTVEDAVKNKGVLSEDNARYIYEQMKSNEELKAAKKNSELMGRIKKGERGIIDDSVINYGEKHIPGTVHWNSLNERQRQAVIFAKGLYKVLGSNLAFVGKNKKFNGAYNVTKDITFIDVFAGKRIKDWTGKDSIISTLSHEITHEMKLKASDAYKIMTDLAFRALEKSTGLTKSELIATEVEKLKNKGESHTDEDAVDEIVARTCEDMLANSKEAKAMLKELSPAEQKTLVEKIQDIIQKIVDWIDEFLSSYKNQATSEEAKALREMKEEFEAMSVMWDKALREMQKFNQALEQSATEESVAENNANEIESLNEMFEDVSGAIGTDGKTMFQYRAMEEDEEIYRGMLNKHKDIIGITDEQIDELFNTIDKALDIIKDNLEALDYAWDVDVDDRAFSPVKPNSDSVYQVSLDFSTLCRKRLLQQTIQQTLQNALNKNLSTEESIAIRDELMKLQEEGRKIEVACALCYVEAARMKSPKQINKFLNNRETIIKDFFSRRSDGSIKEKVKNAELKARKELQKANPDGLIGKNGVVLDPLTATKRSMLKADADYVREAGKKARESYKLTEQEQAELEVAKTMSIDNFTSAKGLENLAKHHPDLFDAYTSFVRNATRSKAIENDTWWRAGDSDSIGDNLIAQMNAENGLRSQSWSDFQVIHLLDYIAATIELSTKGTKRQSYTKVPDYVKLLGNTGDMINMSLIPERVFNGKLSYDGVEGMAYDIAKQLRDEYHGTVGTICIGINNEQIRMLLEDVTIDMVIPYHHSSMSKAVRKLMHIPAWETYQNYQGEKKLSDADAKAMAREYGVNLKKDENYQKAPNFSEWFNLEEARQIAKLENENPSDMKAYKKYGKMYGGYMAMQNAANKYLKLCAERGLAPKFSNEKADFTKDANYWKLLIDRKMVDNVTGEIIEQKAIKPIFSEKSVLEILNDELARYPQVKADQEYATRKVTEKFLSGDMKMDKSTLEAIKKPVDNVTKVNILESVKEDKMMLQGRESEDNTSTDIQDKNYSYETFISKPDMKLMTLDGNVPNNRADIINEAKKKAAKIGKVNTKDNTVWVHVDDVGKDVLIGTDGLKHSLNRGKNLHTQPIGIVTLNAGEILKNSIRINELTPSKESATGSYVLIGAAKDINNMYLVRFIVNEYGNELASMDVLYAINTKKESGVLNAPRYANDSLSDTDSTISIADLLDYVNKYFPDVLPEDIYKHYGHTTRPDGEFSESVLYSDRQEDIYDIMGERDAAIKRAEQFAEDVARLKEKLKLERTITKGRLYDEQSLGGVANFLKKKFGSKVDKFELMKSLKDLYSFMATADINDVDADAIYEKCDNIARSIFEETTPVMDDYTKKIINGIHKTRISLTEEQKAEAINRYGKNWPRYFIGTVTVANDGTPLSAVWADWAEQYPDKFSKDITEADMPLELLETVRNLRESSEIVDTYLQEERINQIATEIYNAYWNISPIKTTADKYSEKIKAIRAEHRKAIKEVRESQMLADDIHFAQKMREQKKELQNKMYAKVRDARVSARERGIELGKKRVEAFKENAERKTRIQSITSNALSLNELLVKNSKDKHVPEIMREPVAALLKAINFSSKRLLEKGVPTKNDISLSKALSKVKDMMLKASNAHDELVELYGHGLDEDIENMVDSVDNIMRSVGDNEFIINRMTLTDLQTLDKMVKTIKHAVNKLNKFHTVHHTRGIANLSQESMLYLDSLGKGKIYDGKRGAIKKLLDWGNALPYYVFKRFGSGGMKVYEALQDGWDKFAFNVKKIIDFANETYTSKEVKEWSKNIKTFRILAPATEYELASENYVPQYQEVQLTVPQIMSMYCLNKREQARGHLFQGGIRVADFKDSKGKIVSQSEGVIFTEKDVQSILDSLTERQKAVADKLQEFMNTVCSDWGNEVSMARFGYKAFGEENYFPIQSDKNNLAVNDETELPNSLFKLLNMSFTKSTIDKANNRIVISDIFDIFAQHTSDMAKYNSLALPVLDSFKWYNYTEKQNFNDGTFRTNGVKQSIEKAFGKAGQNYFTTFLKDINGQQEVSRDTFGKGFYANAKISAVGANLRVILLQPTSFARASAVIDNKYLLKASAYIKVEPIGMVKKLKNGIENAEKYCGMALWKSMGYYDTNIQKGVESQIKHDSTWKDKAVEWTMKGAEIADKVTWGTLWTACEFEIRDTRKDLKVGSEEFYDAIGKRLREVIYTTQVVDSTMTRSQMMRSSDGRDKFITAFASEPTLSYNMIQDAYMELSLDARRIGKKEAWKKNKNRIARIVTAYTITNALAALVESAFDAYREDDDEEMDMIKFMKLYLKNFAFDMSIGNKIPYVKDLYGALQGYSSSRMDIQWAQYLFSALNTKKPSKFVRDSIRSVSQLFGLPFYNAYRDLMAALNKLDLFTSEDLDELFGEFFD